MSEWSFNDLNLILKIAELAGQKILKIYQKGSHQTSAKNDGTPLTEADIVSNEIIQTELKKIIKKFLS
jgi:3'-phosphoadenosine 5'-phosphosulfate (PAPS) 3'-phosphatase